MSKRTTRFAAVVAAGLLVFTATGAATGSGTATQRTLAAAAPKDGGIEYLPRSVLDLQPTRSGRWVNTGLDVDLPRAGTYDLDLDVRGRLAGPPRINSWISARLRNVDTNRVLRRSVRFVNHLHVRDGANVGHQATAPISERITVSGPTTIRLEVTRINQPGLNRTVRAEILSNRHGFTSFRYERV